MDIECPHCHIEFKLDDIVHTLKKGHFKCPVCGEKIPSPLPEHQQSTPPTPIGKYLVPVFIFLGIVTAFAAIYFLTPANKTPPPVKTAAPLMRPPSSGPPPAQVIAATASPSRPTGTTDSEQNADCGTDCRLISQNPYLYAAG